VRGSAAIGPTTGEGARPRARSGRIAPGFVADLLAVREDPLARAAAVRSPAMVFSRGVPVGNK
jgi:imidazolonepropionase-like amidohydrolase